MIEQANDPFTFWLIHYGGFALFGLLALGIIVLPVPEDTLVIFAGILMNQGILPIGTTFILASLGSMCGITVSYFIGRTAEEVLLKKYGKYIGLTEERMMQVHWWIREIRQMGIVHWVFYSGITSFYRIICGGQRIRIFPFCLVRLYRSYRLDHGIAYSWLFLRKLLRISHRAG